MRKDAVSQQAQCRDPLEQGYIIFDRHGPVTGMRENHESWPRKSYHGTSL